MRAGVPFSVALHLGIAAAGMIVAPSLVSEPAPMVILPVELLEIADSTNVAPVAELPDPEELPEEESTPEEAPSEATAAAPEPEEALPAEVIPPKAPEPKAEPEPKPKPAPPKPEVKKESFEDSLDSILKSVDKPKAKPAPSQNTSTSNIKELTDAAPRRGAGDNSRMTITVAEFVRQQLLTKGCWTDQDDMPDAKRLRATFRIRFGRDGRFLEEQQLIEPSRPPAGDQPMQTFIERARRALSKCNQMGFQVPSQYFETSPAQWIEIVFLP